MGKSRGGSGEKVIFVGKSESVKRGIFVTPHATLRAVNIHKSPVCRTAGLGIKEVELKDKAN